MSEMSPLKYKDEVSTDLYCACCQEIFESPCRLQCGHVFCKDCLSNWHSQKNTCPMCRRKFRKNQIKVDRYHDTLVGSLLVYCNFRGCTWNGPRNELEEHARSCRYSKEEMDWAAGFIHENSDKEEPTLFSSLFETFGDKLKSALTEEIRTEQNSFDFIFNLQQSLNAE